jgi:hypothetical protein
MAARKKKTAPFVTVLEIGVVLAILLLLIGTIILAFAP